MDTVTTTTTETTEIKPKTTVVVVRHGERLDYVVRDKGQGGNWIESHQDAPWDPPLTSHGHQQATQLGKSLHSILKPLSIPTEASKNITSVYSSPFLRCRQTSAGIIQGLSSSGAVANTEDAGEDDKPPPPPSPILPSKYDLEHLKVKVEYGLSESLNESWYRSWSIAGTDGTWAYRKKDLPNPELETLHPAAQSAVQPLLLDWKNKTNNNGQQRDTNDMEIDDDNEGDASLQSYMDLDHESITTIDVPYSYATKTFESFKTQRRRMHDTMNTLAKHHPGETIILVSHGGPVTHLYESLTGNHWDTHGEPKYCCYSIYQQDDDDGQEEKNIIVDITPESTKTDDNNGGSKSETTDSSSGPIIKWTPLVVNQQASDANQDESNDMIEEATKKIEKIKTEAAAVAAAAASDSSRSDHNATGHVNVSVAANESLCQECKSNLAKYQCPKCCHRTCSLECCRRHKQRTKCSGKRQRAGTDQFLPLSRMDDDTIKNDYFFLEEVLEQIPRASKVAKQATSSKTSPKPLMTTNANRLIKPASLKTTNKIKNSNESGGNIIISNNKNNDIGQQRQQQNNTNQAKRDKMCRRLEQHCDVRGIKIQIMPNFMERHKQNTSWYSNPLDRITWMVEVFLVVEEGQEQDETKQPIQNKRIVMSWSEDSDLTELVNKVLDASPSSSSSSSSSYHLYMKRLPCPASKPKYIELLDCTSESMSDGENTDEASTTTTTFRTALKGHTVIEYPTLYCVHQSQSKNYPLGTNQITVE
mmetsp:Transcript_50051/g.121266  ORF Transcript_50051/g.121266 Transcript_50051/m.121266 type:complete len:759 (+) Transcript_50051:57-2333(+)